MSDENKKTDKKTDKAKKTGKTGKQENKQEKQQNKKTNRKNSKTGKTAKGKQNRKNSQTGKTAKQEKQPKANKTEKTKKTKKTKNDVVKGVAKKDKLVKNVDKNADEPKPVAVRFSKIYENKNIREILLKYFEEGCVDILPELNDYIKDEIIANKKDIKAPIIRKWLNLLHGKGIVEFTRKKDKKTGWYTYFWKIRADKLIEFAVSDIDNEIKKLEKKIEEIKAHNFACDCRTWTFTEALESDFVCLKCGNVIVEKDNSKLIKEMENKKKVLEKKKEEILLLNK